VTVGESDKARRLLRRQQGMTLLEVLLAVFILAMVVSMVSMTLSGSINVVEATRTQGELYHRAQVALLRISEDLASSVLVDSVEFVGTDREEEGREADSLVFSSTAHVVFDPDHDHPGMAVIAYSVVENKDNEGEFLLLREDHLLTETANAGNKSQAAQTKGGYLLSDRLRSISFTYVDEKGDEQNSWDSEVDPDDPTAIRKLPVSVICTLEFWVDQAAESSIEFTTRILLPAGLINVKKT
jgi:prepilin-type N-terminal cleavage/methylation domain-containing protein